VRVAIHQPQYLPWLGFLDKINSCDIFVILDDVQYKKREFQNRNRIRTPEGAIWVTVPVLTKGRYYQKINEVIIDNSSAWGQEHIRSIESSYRGSRYFDKYFPPLCGILSKKHEELCGLNIEIIRFLMDAFGIKTPLVISSSLGVESSKTRRLIDICRLVGADEYLSGAGGRDYMEEDLFDEAGIRLSYQEFIHPEYEQKFEGFVSHLSSVDYLFNRGGTFPEASEQGGG